MRKTVFVACVILVFAACSTPQYGFHTIQKFEACSSEVNHDLLKRDLLRDGKFLKSPEPRGPYHVYRRPKIIEKSAMATERYEDLSTEMGLALCKQPAAKSGYVVTEELGKCPKEKDCTKDEQLYVTRLLEKKGCKVTVNSSHSERFRLEDRQDFSYEHCEKIVNDLRM